MTTERSSTTATLNPAIERFQVLQDRLLAHYGVEAVSRYYQLSKPPMKVHVLDAGSGEPVILLHGGDGEGVNWAPTMGPLQSRARVIAVDRPGFGLSDAFDYSKVDLRRHAEDFVESLLDAMDIQQATLVGSSMGGLFAIAAALAHPQRVRRLVLVGFAIGLFRELPIPLRIICGVPGMSGLFMRGRPSLESQHKQYRTMFHTDPDKLPEVYFETRIAGIELPSAQGTWATLLPRVGGLTGVRKELVLVDELPKLAMPTMLVMGEHDMAPAEAGRAVIERVPNSRFEYLPGVGHFPYLEAGDRLADLIADFIQ
jgi:pimeloyl-ACP methyl ester carboxylesterase